MRIYRSGKSFEEAIQEDPFNKLIEYKYYFDNIFQDVDSNILLDEE